MTVQFSNGLVLVGNEWKFDSILVNKPLVFLNTVAANTEDLRIQFRKFFQIPLEG